MDEFKIPESSARACVNVAKSNSIGLIANILIKESDCGNILLALGLYFGRRKGADRMGKDLKGKELGPGVMQRKDGDYSARW